MLSSKKYSVSEQSSIIRVTSASTQIDKFHPYKLRSNEVLAHHLSQYLSQHLSEHLSQQHIGIRVKRITFRQESVFQRLFVICESQSPLDPNLVIEPIAECLRNLALRGCRDALISGQVRGASQSNWVVRCDLTPKDEILRSRARWGETTAMELLLRTLLKDCCQTVKVFLERTTISIFCYYNSGLVPKMAVVKAISEFLTQLSPQGITSVILSGILKDSHCNTTQWVHRVSLAITNQIKLSLKLKNNVIHRGHLITISQMLSHQLNPDLSYQLATGGIRVQIRQRSSGLHVMVDALKVPQKELVIQQVQKFFRSLNLEGVTEIYLYGRRAGQPECRWKQKVLMESKKQLPIH